MLVYERGQFVLPHQDSEKDDAMVGTLVVVLPSKHTGGDLVIEKNGKVVERRGSDSRLALTAFHADCHHEVRPVKTGIRIALTFNLLLDGGTAQPGTAEDTAVDDVAQHVRDHFATAVVDPFSRSPAAAPDRLAYLLSHEYTERGLGWDRLKGGDAHRAGLLRAAADRTGCRIMLALTEIKETWDAYPEQRSGRWGGRRYYGWDDHDDYDAEDYDGPYELNDLIEASTTLVRWIDLDGKAEKITLDLDEDEACAGTATADLQPYEQQYEGYMGNYGNTLDRWYRRAALVLFPADREFAIRAEASPAWAMPQIGKRARAGDLVGARADAAGLAPFWAAQVRQSPQPGSLGKALSTAYALEDPDTAALLLEPFRAEHLSAAAGAPLTRLAKRYGAAWTATVLRGWFAGHSRHLFGIFGPKRLAWYAALPELCAALTAVSSTADAAHTLVELSWRRLLDEAGGLLGVQAPSRRDPGLAELGLVLTKLETLFTDERTARAKDEADLAWLGAAWPSADRATTGAH